MRSMMSRIGGSGLRRAASHVLATFVLFGVTASAVASSLGEAVGARVSIGEYRHYHQDLLYTYLGDNRGFGPEHDLARANIQSTLESFGLDVALEPFIYNGGTYYNVVATQIGIDHPDEVVVIGAHFDSVNNPGADDNGTGTAMVMEMARTLSPLRSSRTIKYVLFDREEQGRRGSIAFVNTHAAENIIFAVTADMVGHDSGAYGMDVYGTPASGAIVNGVGNAILTYGDTLNRFINIGNYSFSDHWSFESAGIPACVIIERNYFLNPHYHQPTDAVDIAPDYIDYGMLDDLLRSVAGYLADTVEISVYGDVNLDGVVDIGDLLEVIVGWGLCPAPPDECNPDVNGDGAVDVQDLVLTVTNWS